MKKKLSKYDVLIDAISKTTTFKILLVLSFFTILYGVSLSNTIKDYFLCILMPYGTGYFNIMFFVILLVNTFNNCNVTFKNYNYVIRLENRKNLSKNIITINFIINLIWIFIFTFVFVSILSLHKLEYLSFYNMKSYGINISIYTIFYILRYYIFSLLISTIFSLIYIKSKDKNMKIVYIIILIFLVGFQLDNPNVKVVKSFQILPWRYFVTINYQSFMTELSYSLLYCIILEIVTILLYNINQKRIRLRCKSLYFFVNDIEYFIKKQKLILVLYFILPIICSICFGRGFSRNYIFQTSLGLNIDRSNPYILSVLIYILNILGCIYLFIRSFNKDYSNVLNIYLRYNYKKFFILKSIILFFIFFILKVLQYSIILIFISIFYNGVYSGVIHLFFNDLFFVLFLVFLFLLFYIIYKIFDKTRFLIYILIFIYIYMFFIKLVNISQINFIYYIILFALEVLIINFILVKNNKKVIQEIGGV